jgi:hypothetical protein
MGAIREDNSEKRTHPQISQMNSDKRKEIKNGHPQMKMMQMMKTRKR